jgi:hypothetical protein
MNTNSRRSRRLAAGCLAAVVLAGLAGANPAAGSSHPPNDGAQSFDRPGKSSTTQRVDYTYEIWHRNAEAATWMPQYPPQDWRQLMDSISASTRCFPSYR